MTATSYWESSLHKYQVVIAEDDVTSACEWLAEQGFDKLASWWYHSFDVGRAVFIFVDNDTAMLFKLRWL